MRARDLRRRRQHTAIHESGHAIAALACGAQVHGVTIRPSGRTMGQCRCAFTDRNQRAIVLVAGYLAEIRASVLAGRRPRGILADGTLAMRTPFGGDGRDTEKMLRKDFPECPSDRWGEVIREAFRLANQVIESNWPAVLALTDLLVAKTTVDAAEVRRVYQDHTTLDSIVLLPDHLPLPPATPAKESQ